MKHDWVKIRRKDLDDLIYYSFIYGVHYDKSILDKLVQIVLSSKELELE